MCTTFLAPPAPVSGRRHLHAKGLGQHEQRLCICRVQQPTGAASAQRCTLQLPPACMLCADQGVECCCAVLCCAHVEKCSLPCPASCPSRPSCFTTPFPSPTPWCCRSRKLRAHRLMVTLWTRPTCSKCACLMTLTAMRAYRRSTRPRSRRSLHRLCVRWCTAACPVLSHAGRIAQQRGGWCGPSPVCMSPSSPPPPALCPCPLCPCSCSLPVCLCPHSTSTSLTPQPPPSLSSALIICCPIPSFIRSSLLLSPAGGPAQLDAGQDGPRPVCHQVW